MSGKLIYVPKTWKLNNTDFDLKANEEYKIIMNDDSVRYITIDTITKPEGEGSEIITPKVILIEGSMFVMRKATSEDCIFAKDIKEIIPVSTKYNRSSRSVKDKIEETQPFTFAFDSTKFQSQYKITIFTGEFVALSTINKKATDSRNRILYGEIEDVKYNEEINEDEIIFNRYISNKGVRSIYTMNLPISSLLGIFRYDLQIIEDKKEIEEE